ncbi:IbrB-like domain-containing protein [Natrinema thermotolerans]|uniref:IbrB-like domain-containing protein n=1 Tax=Natrinema thermotolerans TaxID=121872 RepID=UPI0009FEF720|nr:ParB/RepB/Spo0J family partition protein [Natrinema thermotolerans]QCC57257.1 hypothetical protein DVR14_00865 [Natrinema thermotolerans]
MTDGIQATLEQALEDAQDDDSDGDGLSEDLLLEAIDAYFEGTDDVDEQVATLNALRERLHELSPFQEPVEHIKWVKQEDVEGNDYNPNEVATPEMDLLHKSIKEDGYTQPIVTYEVGDGEFEVVDGYHRTLIGKTRDDIRERLHDHVPVTVIDKPREERMSSTIRHNRARGTHQIRDMSELVVDLYDDGGWDDERIMEELGMERDEVLRLKQVSGLKEAFAGHEFSQSWTEYEDRHGDDGDE